MESLTSCRVNATPLHRLSAIWCSLLTKSEPAMSCDSAGPFELLRCWGVMSEYVHRAECLVVDTLFVSQVLRDFDVIS